MRTLLQEKAFPPWLKKSIRNGFGFKETKEILAKLGLNTVCQSALCPNIYDCFSQKRTTFLILGNHCTRNCRFCAVPLENLQESFGKPDPMEPLRIKNAVQELGLSHVIITSVTRDDIEDGGSRHFAECIKILKTIPNVFIEVLVPDFKGASESIKIVIDAGPDIFSHNIETVPSLYPKVRPQSNYQISLSVLSLADFFRNNFLTKSSIMVGLGENIGEIKGVMADLRKVNCDIITIGQYLRPTQANIEVSEFVKPEQFIRYSEIAKEFGFKKVFSGPFVRSSYVFDGLSTR